MSKRVARQRKRRSAKPPRQIKRRAIIIISLLLPLTVVVGIAAQWKMLPGMTRPPAQPQAGSFNANSPSKEYVYAGGRLIATEEPAAATQPAPLAPTQFLATDLSASTIRLEWVAPSGAFDHYQIERKANKNDAYGVVNANVSSTATQYDDNSAAVNTAYLYRICAVSGSQSTCSDPDLSTTTVLRDYPFQQGSLPPIRAYHFLDLMDAVNAVRMLAGMPTITWSTGRPAPAVGGAVYYSHFNDLRDGLEPALTALGLTGPRFQLPAQVSSGTNIYGAPLQQLQTIVK